jgi:hypothetical protein
MNLLDQQTEQYSVCVELLCKGINRLYNVLSVWNSDATIGLQKVLYSGYAMDS